MSREIGGKSEEGNDSFSFAKKRHRVLWCCQSSVHRKRSAWEPPEPQHQQQQDVRRRGRFFCVYPTKRTSRQWRGSLAPWLSSSLFLSFSLSLYQQCSSISTFCLCPIQPVYLSLSVTHFSPLGPSKTVEGKETRSKFLQHSNGPPGHCTQKS